MSIAAEVIDVVIISAVEDKELAELVRRKLADSGLRVNPFYDDFADNEHIMASLREALAETAVVVVLVTQNGHKSTNLIFAVGAALAWAKPIQIVRYNVRDADIPAALRSFPKHVIFELDSLTQNVLAIARSEPLTEPQTRHLIEVYQQLETPVDVLFSSSFKLMHLTTALKDKFNVETTPETVMQQLLRLRKEGRLPLLSGE